MYRFFVDADQLNNDYIEITGDDYNHIRNVLRMKVGESVLLSCGDNREYEAIIEKFSESNNDSEEKGVKSHHCNGKSKEPAVLLKITDVFGNA